MSRNPKYVYLINSGKWQKLRLKKIKANPLCEECLIKGITKEAEEVHHITPVESTNFLPDMEILAYDYNNLQSLCKECHKEKHNYKKQKEFKMKEDATQETKDFFRDFLE